MLNIYIKGLNKCSYSIFFVQKDKAHSRSLTKTLDPVKKSSSNQNKETKSKDGEKSKEKSRESKKDREKSRERKHKSDDPKRASKEKDSKPKESPVAAAATEEEKIEVPENNAVNDSNHEENESAENQEQLVPNKEDDVDPPQVEPQSDMMNGEVHEKVKFYFYNKY